MALGAVVPRVPAAEAFTGLSVKWSGLDLSKTADTVIWFVVWSDGRTETRHGDERQLFPAADPVCNPTPDRA